MHVHAIFMHSYGRLLAPHIKTIAVAFLRASCEGDTCSLSASNACEFVKVGLIKLKKADYRGILVQLNLFFFVLAVYCMTKIGNCRRRP